MNQVSESAEAPHSRRLSVLWKIALGLFVLTALAVALLPYGVQWYLAEWLRENGLVNVSIGDVDINPFVGLFTIRSLEFEDDTGQHRAGHAALDLNWTELMNKRIRLSQIELRDTSLDISRTESNRWLIGAIVVGAQQAVEEAEESEAESGWGFGIDQLWFEDVDIVYHDPLIERELTIDSLALDNFASWNPTQATTLNVVLSAEEAGLAVSGDAYPFADTFELDLEVQGNDLEAADLRTLLAQAGIESLTGLLHTNFRIEVTAPPDSGTSMAITGSLQFEDWTVTWPGQSLALTNLLWDGKLDVGLFGDTNTLSGTGTVQLNEVALSAPPADVNLASMSWQGLVTGEAGEQGEVAGLDGELTFGEAQFEDASSQLRAAMASLRWQGKAATSSQENWRLDAEGEIAGAQFSAGYDGQPQMLALSSFITDVRAREPGELLSLGAIALTDLNILKRTSTDTGEPSHVVSLARVDLDTLAMGDGGLVIGDVLLSDAQVWLERARDGVLALGIPNTATGSADSTPQATIAEQNAQGTDAEVAFSLAGVKTAGDSNLVYLDRSVKPVARLELTPLTVAIGRIDGARPEVDTPITVSASEGRYGRLTFAGQLRPLAQAAHISGTGSMKDINMIELDGFARRAIGYAIRSGTLSAELEVALQDEFLDSSAELTIRHLDIDALKAEEQDEFSTELGVPLGTALGLLEDDKETIRLTIPIKGDLADLSVGIGGAIRLVMKKGLLAGMQTAATSYFAPLWPALAASKLYAAASSLRFREATFAPGVTEMNAEQREYIDNMAGLLAKRPKVNLTLCGRAVAADVLARFPDSGEALNEEQRAELSEIVEERQHAIKDGLIDAGIDSARLVTCIPEVRPEDQGLPRVVFGV